MRNNKSLKLALIGGGLNSVAGHSHFAATRMDHNFEVVAGVFSRNPDNNRKAANFWGVKNYYNTLDELLAKERANIDAIAVLLPTPDHGQVVAKLLREDVPVICEKPLVYNLDEIEMLKSIYKPEKHFLVTTYNYCGYPLVRELKAMIEAGEMGEIHDIQLEMPQESFLRPPKNLDYPSGWRKVDKEIPTVCLDLGSHLFQMQTFLTGKIPTKCVCKMNSFAPYGVMDDVKIIEGFEDGTTGYMWFGKIALGNRNGLRIRVYGTKASAEWFQAEPEKLLMAYSDGSITTVERGNAKRVAAEKRYNRMFAGHPAGFVEAFANLYQDIAEALRKFKVGEDWTHPYLCGLDDEEKNFIFFEKAVRSNKENHWTEIEEREFIG